VVRTKTYITLVMCDAEVWRIPSFSLVLGTKNLSRWSLKDFKNASREVWLSFRRRIHFFGKLLEFLVSQNLIKN
jgi:hypothetical protein